MQSLLRCPACGTDQFSGERFCSECGADLPLSNRPQAAQPRHDAEHIFTGLDFSLDFEIREAAVEAIARRISSSTVDEREALPSYSMTADEFQLQVIHAKDQTIRLVAPAGSGKTQTLVNRVLTQVRDGLNPTRILMLTFDNAAANSIRAKLDEQTAAIATRSQRPFDVRGLTVSTLNAFGYGLLRTEAPAEYKPLVARGMPRRIVREVKQALRQVDSARAAALPSYVDDYFYVEFFSLLKNEIIDPRRPDAQRFADFVVSARQADVFFPEPTNQAMVRGTIQTLLWMYQAYDRVLVRDRLMDFDDQKLRAYAWLMDNPDLLRAVQGRYSEVIVDEFQDINRLDFELIREIARSARLVVTGDDDQAIYGFRGCTPDYIINLEHHLGRPIARYELRTNYRCPANIVRDADRLIQHNTVRIPKHPIANRSDEAAVMVTSTLSAGLEAKTLIAYIKRIREANPEVAFNEVAVLYRTNAQSLPIQVELILEGMPYHVRKEDNILSNHALSRLLAVLRTKLALMSQTDPSLDDQVQTVRAAVRFLDDDDTTRIRRVLSGTGNFLAAIHGNELFDAVPRLRRGNLPAAMDELLRAKDLQTELDVLRARFQGLDGLVGSLEDVVDQKASLAEITEVAANFGADTREFVETMDRALARARSTNAGNNLEGVNLLTYFRAKGLQWHTVILTTCNDGLIPHRKAPVDDERRLFYVALTRATSNLLVSYLNNVCGNRLPPSRFLSEAGLLK